MIVDILDVLERAELAILGTHKAWEEAGIPIPENAKKLEVDLLLARRAIKDLIEGYKIEELDKI